MNLAIALLISSTVLRAADGAPAQPTKPRASPTDPAERKKATDDRFNAGLKLADRGRDVEARIEFEQAFALTPNPQILFNLARTEQFLGESLKALRHYRQVLRDFKEFKNDTDSKSRGHIAELEPQFGRIKLEGADALDVTIDGEPVLRGVDTDVTPGKHIAKGKSSDGKEIAVEVVAPAATITIVRFQTSPPVKTDAVLEAPAPSTTPPVQDSIAPSVTTYETPQTLQPLPKKIVVGTFVAGTVIFAAGAIYWQTVASGRAGDEGAFLSTHGTSGDRICGVRGQSCTEFDSLHKAQGRAVDANRAWLGAAALTGVAAIGTWLIWPKTKANGTRISPTVGGLLLEGSF